MATSMGIRQLRDTLTETIRRVRRGETIEVTHHGAPIAVISPMPEDRMQRLIASGDVTRPEPLDAPLRRHRVTGDLTAGEALAEDRADR